MRKFADAWYSVGLILIFLAMVSVVVMVVVHDNQDEAVLLAIKEQSGPMHEHRLAELLRERYSVETVEVSAQRLAKQGYITSTVAYEDGDLCGGTIHWEYSLTPKGQQRMTFLRNDTGPP